MRWSIRYQLILPLLILGLGVTAMSIGAGYSAVHHAREKIEKQVRQIAHTLDRSSFPLTENVLHLIKGFSGADFLLLPKNGKALTTLEEIPVGLKKAAWPGKTKPDWHLDQRIVVKETSYLYLGVWVRKGRPDEAFLYIFYPESLWKEAMWQAIRPALFLGIASGSGALLVTLLLAHRLTGRVRELEKRTRLIAAGDFSPMQLPRSNDELRDLAQSVNDMAQQLEIYREVVQKNERLRLLGQVSGGLAHQLRNGVTGARLAVQVHARECDRDGDPESLDVALRQLALVEMHLKRFLDLGRGGELRKSSCSLIDLLEETISLLRPQCKHSRIELRWQPPAWSETIMIYGDAGQLGHLFLNVLTNAVEAAGPGGWVDIRLERNGPDQVLIEIRDSGQGPAEEVARHLFEPFVTGKPEGVGLGLSVARQVVEAHGGRISWYRETGVTCFLIQLPWGPVCESNIDRG